MLYDRHKIAGPLFFMSSLVAGCASEEATTTTAALTPEALGASLARACPMASPDDRAARDACAAALATAPELKGRMAGPVFWGAQRPGTGTNHLLSDRTEFEPLVWKRLYLSTFMFGTGHRVETADDGTSVVRVPVRFRGGLDPGDFPYPFWHSRDKWASYQTAIEILFFVRDGVVIGGLRSAERDETRPRDERPWDGQWVWASGRGEEPQVTLFRYLLSAANPHAADLDRAYRTLERGMRKETCLVCHAPDNSSKMNPLELLSYPNQALSARHEIVATLRAGTMPPPDAGVAARARSRGDELLDAAIEFARVADLALAHEGDAPAKGQRARR